MTSNIHTTTQSFLTALSIICSIIATAELLIMLLLDYLPKWGILLTPQQDIIVDTLLLSLLVTPAIWVLTLKPLALKVIEQQERNLAQTKENLQLHQALNAVSLVSIVDLNKKFTHVNPLFCDTSGYTEAELLNQTYELIDSGMHDPKYFIDLWQQIIQGQAWQGEICHRNKSGKLYWHTNTIFPMRDQHEKITHFISIGREITQIKENNNQLSALKSGLDASNDMVLVTDKNGCIQYVNPELCRFTGWTEKQLLGRSPSILDSLNNDATVIANMNACLRQGKAWNGRMLNRRKGAAPFNIAGQASPPDSHDFWVFASITPIYGELTGELPTSCTIDRYIPSSNEQGKAFIGYVQIQRNISAEVAHEQSLILENHDSAIRLAIADILQQPLTIKERFTQVLDSLFNLKANDIQRKGGVFLKNPDEDFLDMFLLNGPFSEEFIRREQRIAFGDCLCGRAAISQELLVSDDCFCDPRHEHQFNGMKAHGHYIVPIVSSGVTLGIMFLYTDPYPVKLESRFNMLQQVGDMMALALLQERAKLSLEAARDAAELSAKTRSEFLANMSHEIRTPMNGVIGMLDILRDTELSTDQYELVETVTHSAESLLTIINDILDISKLEAGKIELEDIPFNIHTLVEEVCALLCSRAHAKNLEFACFVPPTLPQMWHGDPTRIRQVLTNLIGNAIKFTEQGEVLVTVKSKPTRDGDIELRFEIKDTGIGMSPESQARLFQPFAQADSSTARRFGGTGLGLAICKNLIDIMQGAIGAESAVGQGTLFWFNLPLGKVEQETNTLENPVPLAILEGKRVLVVDDNATNRKILHHYLQHWGVIIGESECGVDALFELESAVKRGEAYDMLLSDYHMPNMDGFALARAINNNPLIANTPRLLLSSGGIDTKADRQSLGFTHSLLKPVRQTQLFEAMSNALQVAVKKVVTPTQSITEQANYGGKRILVAEDNEVNQRVIIRMLSKFQCVPDIAENGQIALDKLVEGKYDLVFMDCQMPIMDGYEAVRNLRGWEFAQQIPRLPVIALTAHAAAGEREKCLEAGMDDFMSKPIVRADLAKLLAHWLHTDDLTADVPTKTDPEMINAADCWDEVAAMNSLEDDHELLYSIMESYLKETPLKLTQLSEALARKDLVAISEIAHSLNSMGGLFFAKQLRADAIELELMARDHKPVDYQRLTQNLNNAATKLMTVFSTRLAEISLATEV